MINEYSCGNVSNYPDNFSKYEDWIEIYNSSGSPVNIGGYYLSDRLNQPTKWMIPIGTSIGGNARMIFFAQEKILQVEQCILTFESLKQNSLLRI